MADGCNDTLGDIIDLENIDQIKDQVLMAIKTRKSKRKACSKEGILENIDIGDAIFDKCIEKLEQDGKIKVSTRAGKKVFTPNDLERKDQVKDGENEIEMIYEKINSEGNYDNFCEDFVDFKRYVSETLAILNDKIENVIENPEVISMKSNIDKYKTELASKDVIISILREEISHLRSQNISLIESIRRNHSGVKTQISSHDVTDYITDKNSVKKSLNTHENSSNINSQLFEVRAQMKASYDDMKNDKVKLDVPTNVINNKPIMVNNKKNQAKIVNSKVRKNTVNSAMETTVTNQKKASQHEVNVEIIDKPERKKVFIVGDSIVNGLNYKLLNKNHYVKVHSHGGGTTDDMTHHVQTFVKRKPDMIIVHSGTNDTWMNL